MTRPTTSSRSASRSAKRTVKKSAAKKRVKAKAASRKSVVMRIPETALSRIDRAAEISSSTRTAFMVQAAEIAAANILLDQTTFRLDDAAYNAFVAALDAPAKPPAALVELMRMRPPWEE